MGNPTLIKNKVAEGAVAPHRIVKHGTGDNAVLQAAAATDALMGVCGAVGPAVGERVDITQAGIEEVEYGGNVTRGQPLTSDADGKAIAAAPAAGANVRIIGFAEVSAVAGDIGPLLIAPGLMQG